MTSVLDYHEISIGFPNQNDDYDHVVDRVCLSINAGERVGLIGESGSGKTLLALQATGVTPAPGRLLNGSIRVSTRPGLVMQDASSALNPVFTIGSQIQEIAGSRRPVMELLHRVGFEDPDAISKAYPHQLSGGQAQRAYIALALAGDPECLIADEPTSGLDSVTCQAILEVFRELVESSGVGLLLISHDLPLTAQFCERLAVMHGGRIVEQGSPEQLLGNPLHPFTQMLARPFIEQAATPSRVVPEYRLDTCRFIDGCALAEPSCATACPPLQEFHDGRLVRCPVAIHRSARA